MGELLLKSMQPVHTGRLAQMQAQMNVHLLEASPLEALEDIPLQPDHPSVPVVWLSFLG